MSDWTPQRGLASGLAAAGLLGVALGALLLVVLSFVSYGDGAFSSRNSAFSDFFWSRLFVLWIVVGLGYAALLNFVAEQVAGMGHPAFLAAAAVLACCLAAAVTLLATHLTHWQAGSVTPVAVAAIWVGLPIAVGGCAPLAALLR